MNTICLTWFPTGISPQPGKFVILLKKFKTVLIQSMFCSNCYTIDVFSNYQTCFFKPPNFFFVLFNEINTKRRTFM